MQTPLADTPIVCDVSTAPDTAAERLAEYQRLFATALIARERTPEGAVPFRFRADDGVEAWVRDLAAREQACCAFFAFEVTTTGEQVHWDARTMRMTVASTVTAVARPTPTILTRISSMLAKLMNTTDMMIAAAVITRPVRANPAMTARSGSLVSWYPSRIAERKKTS